MTEALIASNTAPALIAATIARLAPRLQLAVEDFPDRPEDYDLMHPIGAVLVRYRGSKYGSPMDVGITIQERSPVIELTLITRDLNGPDGATAYIEQLLALIQGWKPTAFDKCRIVRDEFQDEQAGLWRHVIDFQTTTNSVEQVEEPDVSIATQMTFNDGEGNEKVLVPRA